MSAIEAHDLGRTYYTRTGVLRRTAIEIEAVRGINLHVERGELFGLLGPNGAGKTTTIKMLITLLLPTTGTARVLGHDVVRDAAAVRRRIGYVFGGDRGLYERLSARDNLRYFAELYGVPGRNQRSRIAELIELVGLAGHEAELVEGFSRGMRQRLHIARGLLHDPDVLFLDEPTIGIDPVGARELRATIATLIAAEKTVLLTTHYMFEADELCDRIAVVASGQLLAEGTPAELKGQVDGGHIFEVEVFGSASEALAAVRAVKGVRTAVLEERESGQVLSVRFESATQPAQHVLRCLGELPIGRITTREPSLEDAYVALVSQSDDAAKDGAAKDDAVEARV